VIVALAYSVAAGSGDDRRSRSRRVLRRAPLPREAGERGGAVRRNGGSILIESFSPAVAHLQRARSERLAEGGCDVFDVRATFE